MKTKTKFNFKSNFIFSALLLFTILLSLNFIFAFGCWDYRGANTGGSSQQCLDAGCIWTTSAQPPCTEALGCCMSNECWQYDGNQTLCTNSTDALNCSWDAYMKIYMPNGTLMNTGGCMNFYNGTGGGGGGMVSDGCWNLDGAKSACYANTKCNWKPNNANQNPSCWIKSLVEAKGKNPSATGDDIGCCEQKGCWSYDGNQTECLDAMPGFCSYDSTNKWCMTKWCNELVGQTNCSFAATTMFMPCQWNSGQSKCEEKSGGSFSFYNDTDSCMSAGGWYNASGNCVMPSSTIGGGSGGFMFASEVRCWFADQQPGVCRNITGCAYCSNTTSQINNASSACYNMPMGLCQGHEVLPSQWNGTTYFAVVDIDTVPVNCTHIRLRSACQYGPLPNCIWSNSSSDVGAYCNPGTSTMQKLTPPVPYCEHPSAQNDYSLCLNLSTTYMMPCKWGNPLSNQTLSDNCTFNSNAVFGSGNINNQMDYGVVSNEMSCTAAGGTWKSEYYFDIDNSFKKDSWCEKGAIFSFTSGQAFGNKGNCNSDCWACEFTFNGTSWANVTLAQIACLNSTKGVCQWRTDSNAPNKLGWCDYPKEFSFVGNVDCSVDCKGCDYVGNSTQTITACYGSPAGCTWVNYTATLDVALSLKGGYCMSASKKSCSSECTSCFDQSSCSNSSFHSSMNCSWDPVFKFCKSFGFTGEVCFNGIDDDNDGMMDCGDSDCTYDQFCGGGSTGATGVDCNKLNTTLCNQTITSSGRNCTFVVPQYSAQSGGMPYCAFPGTNCWMYHNDISSCDMNIGCIFRNATAGYSAGATGSKVTTKNFTGYCDINESKSSSCYNATYAANQANCNSFSACQWVSDSYILSGGRCEFRPFAICSNSTNSINVSTCAAAESAGTSICIWVNNSFSPNGGFCEPKCRSLSVANCGSLMFCTAKTSVCEPEMFGGMGTGSGGGYGGIGGGGFGCHMYDGNKTVCDLQNVSCIWSAFSQNNSQGVCDMKGQSAMFSGMDMSPPKILGTDSADLNLLAEVDIREYGVKDMTGSLGFGMMLQNITNASVCKGYYVGGGMGTQPKLGTGEATVKYYWFLDTNKNVTDGCNATMQDKSNLRGFEFMIKYVVYITNGSTTEIKSLYKCSETYWALTSIPLSSNRQMMCGMTTPSSIGGVMVIVDKESLQAFSAYNKTAPMRTFASSGSNTSDSELNPSDAVPSIGYYTLGSADFKFVDCANPANKNDDKCKNFNKFGFNIFEDCKNGVDDDGDGLSDCSDPKCKFTPVCSGGAGTAFNFVADANDKQTPSISFSQVDIMWDSAFIKFDSNEPANGTLDFYRNDSGCTTLNISIYELGDPSIAYDDYKPFHFVGLDIDNLGYSLVNGTAYYYKTTICDSSNNCGTSACQNFTTKTDATYKNFIFKMKIPAGYNVTIPQLNYSGNFTTNVGGKVYETGIKTNASISKKLNITVNCGTQSLTFVGADILKPKSIDTSGAFVCDPTNNILGMNSSSKAWNQLVGDIGMGGSSDYIKLVYPVAYSADNTIRWCNDEITNCTDVNTYATCSSGGTGKTDCKIPTSLGFSAYQITLPTPPGGTTGGGGGGGGAGGTTYALGELTSSKTKEISISDKISFNVSKTEYKLYIINLSTGYANVRLSSPVQNFLLLVGEEKNADVNKDGILDIIIKLQSTNSISQKATFVLSPYSIIASITGEEIAAETEGTTEEESAGEVVSEATGKFVSFISKIFNKIKESKILGWSILVICVAAVIAGVFLIFGLVHHLKYLKVKKHVKIAEFPTKK